jgi:D-alanyl-D-alanine carboxypeptidase/D-alanyl-D-alanine-endopeptidase (penicillin-binding protein 4)
VTLAAATAVTVAVVGGYVVERHGNTSSPAASSTPSPSPSTSASPQPSSPPTRGPVLAPLNSTAPLPAATGLADFLASASRTVAQNSHLVGEVVDADTGAKLWSRGAANAEPPASTTKLLTATAALTALGPDFRLTTTTRRSGRTVYLVGGGDPTIVRSASSIYSPSYPRPASLATLARETVAALGATRTVRLRLDTSAWSGPTMARGWKADYVTEGDITPPSALELNEGRLEPQDEFSARTEDPAAQAGEAFAQLLTADGVHVLGRVKVGDAAAASAPLASVSSPPLAELVQRMLTVSDDDLAEALGRAVARKAGMPATFVGAAAAVKAQLASLGIPTEEISLQDTSGLSHQDRISPRVLVDVLRTAMSPSHPQLRSIIEGLPIAGLTGTLETRYLDKPSSYAAGVLRAKTGTLTGVNALAGIVVDHSGRLLIFAFLTSNAPLPGLTVPALDQLAASLARCGCRS